MQKPVIKIHKLTKNPKLISFEIERTIKTEQWRFLWYFSYTANSVEKDLEGEGEGEEEGKQLDFDSELLYRFQLWPPFQYIPGNYSQNPLDFHLSVSKFCRKIRNIYCGRNSVSDMDWWSVFITVSKVWSHLAKTKKTTELVWSLRGI